MKKLILSLLLLATPILSYADITQGGYTYYYSNSTSLAWSNINFFTNTCDLYIFDGSGNYVTQYYISSCATITVLDINSLGFPSGTFRWVLSDAINPLGASCVVDYATCVGALYLYPPTSTETDSTPNVSYYFGCTDNTKFNYNASANIENGSCTSFVYGCIDSNAYNYNASANTSDGSCRYTATSTAMVSALGSINFGLGIIIVLAFIGFIGYVYNLMKKKKAWR